MMFESLESACRAAIDHGNCINDPQINLDKWGETYRHDDGTPRSEAEVRAVWEAIQGEGKEPPPFLEPAPEQIDE